jgi:hypothetical protein
MTDKVDSQTQVAGQAQNLDRRITEFEKTPDRAHLHALQDEVHYINRQVAGTPGGAKAVWNRTQAHNDKEANEYIEITPMKELAVKPAADSRAWKGELGLPKTASEAELQKAQDKFVMQLALEAQAKKPPTTAPSEPPQPKRERSPIQGYTDLMTSVNRTLDSLTKLFGE